PLYTLSLHDALPISAEDRVLLRINGLLQFAAPSEERRARAGAWRCVAGLAGQAAENEAVEPCVIGRGLEAERPERAPQPGLDRFCDLDLEVGITDIEGRSRVVRSSGKQLGGFRRALDILRG